MAQEGPFPVRADIDVCVTWDKEYLIAKIPFYHPSFTLHFMRKRVPDPCKHQGDEKKIMPLNKKSSVKIKQLTDAERRRVFTVASEVFAREDNVREYEEAQASFPGMELPTPTQRRRLIREEEQQAPRARVDHKRPPF